MSAEPPPYVVRLATTPQDLTAAQRLRYQVFVGELGGDGPLVDHALGLERDAFDPVFDHLILVDRRIDPASGTHVIGAYRVLPSDRRAAAGRFYSETEFDLSPLLASGRKLLELGRSCVHADHRGGTAMFHLWNGLAEYVLDRGIEVLFGAASFHGTDVAALAQPLAYLHHHHLAPPAMRVRALPPHRQEMALIPPGQLDRRAAMAATPALIKAYLRLEASSATAPGSTATSTPPTCALSWTPARCRPATANSTSARPGHDRLAGHPAAAPDDHAPRLAARDLARQPARRADLRWPCRPPPRPAGRMAALRPGPPRHPPHHQVRLPHRAAHPPTARDRPWSAHDPARSGRRQPFLLARRLRAERRANRLLRRQVRGRRLAPDRLARPCHRHRLHRPQGTEAKKQQETFEARLKAGHRLLFFPEGTSTDAIRVLPFKSTLFQAFFSPALEHTMHIQPVTVIFHAPPGEDPRHYGWWGDMDFASHLLKALATPRQGRVEVIFHPEVPVDAFQNRKVLAQHCERVIRTAHVKAIA